MEQALTSAYELLKNSILYQDGNPIGTLAALDESIEAANYDECFVRDFVPSALVFLMDGETEIVRNFLIRVMQLRNLQQVMEGHERQVGLMPASFRVTPNSNGPDELSADFGDRAIGRVAPVDSAMWWMLILRAYVVTTGDTDLAHSEEFQVCMQLILKMLKAF